MSSRAMPVALFVVLFGPCAGLHVRTAPIEVAQTNAKVDIPSEPGCYVRIPTGCKTQGDPLVAFNWTRDVFGEQLKGADTMPWTCEEVRKNDYNQRCATNDAQMLYIMPRVDVFIAVFSRVNAVDRRAKIRDMWLRAAKTSPTVRYKFAVCGGERNMPLDSIPFSRLEGGYVADATFNSNVLPQTLMPRSYAFLEAEGADNSLLAKLAEEHETFHDVLYLNCSEGYGHGMLTRKLVASLRFYHENTNNAFFMKIDDDSFLSWHKYSPQLARYANPNLYMGISIGEAVPCRDENFRWYEPYSTYDGDKFPRGMAGGSGYTLGRNVVENVLHTGTADNHVLYNEDRAVGVWMNLMATTGTDVKYIGLQGIDGFWAWDWKNPTKNWKTWGGYPHTVHHGLEPDTIACLSRADDAQEKNRDISKCFEPEVGKFYEPLRCAELTKQGMHKA